MFTYVTLDGLSPNKQYEFRVFGVNDVGSGPKTDIMITTTSEAGEEIASGENGGTEQ
jgi:hypothetical protein